VKISEDPYLEVGYGLVRTSTTTFRLRDLRGVSLGVCNQPSSSGPKTIPAIWFGLEPPLKSVYLGVADSRKIGEIRVAFEEAWVKSGLMDTGKEEHENSADCCPDLAGGE